MSFNTFGKTFRFTTWGESHGPAIGCIIDGCPPNIPISEKEIQKDKIINAIAITVLIITIVGFFVLLFFIWKANKG